MLLRIPDTIPIMAILKLAAEHGFEPKFWDNHVMGEMLIQFVPRDEPVRTPEAIAPEESFQ